MRKISIVARRIAISQNAKKLKQTTALSTVYLSPDRSPDERTARRDLVENLRAKIKKEPEFYHFIKGGKFCKTDRKVKAVKLALSTSSGDGRGKSSAVGYGLSSFQRLGVGNQYEI